MSDLDINDAVLAELRAAADIVEVISDHTRLKKAGRSWKGLCPFHNERTPSFHVDRDKGLYHCFGCGAGGDVIHFVRQADRLEFPDAVEMLAERFGVKIPRRASRGPRDDRREALLAALADAQRFYAANLARRGNKGLAYLESRGVSEDLARRLGMGLALDSWDALQKHLAPAHPEALLQEAGLLQPRSEKPGSYDRFRDRLLFTVRDERGRPVGFSGRALSKEQEPKYLNSPESPVFLKKRLLYGLSDARDAIRRNERVVLVEGHFDHLALIAAGVEETVASQGTALTPEQAERLRRLSPEVIVCYDGDEAGREATRKALGLLLAQGVRVRVTRLPADSDPHDVLTREGAAALTARIEEAPDAVTWLLEDLAPNAEGLPAAEKTARIHKILEPLRQIGDGILRYEEFRKVSRAVGVPLDILWKGEESRRPAPAAAAPAPSPVATTRPPAPLPKLESRLIQALSRGGFDAAIFARLRDDEVVDPRARRLVETFRRQGTTAHPADEQDAALLAAIVLEDAPEPSEASVARLLQQLEAAALDRRGADLQAQIDRAEASGLVGEELARLAQEKQELMRRRSKLPR
ncbi:MAG TPA: DNA primase [Thermoanaerobaculia bacterium]